MKHISKSTLIPMLLLVYLAVMSYIGYADYAAGISSPMYYFGVIGATLIVIFLLHLSLKRKEKLRSRRHKERDDI